MSYQAMMLSNLQSATESTLGIEKLKDKTILVTGATGQIGSFIVQSLSEYSFENNFNLTIIAVGRNEEKLHYVFRDYIKNDNIVFMIQDFSESFEWNFSCDYIIHAASNADPKSYSKYPIDTMNVNYISTLNLLNYAKEKNIIRFAFISTGEVYGETEQPESISEQDGGYIDSMKPRSCYPISKRAAETLCVSFKEQYDLDIIVLRLSHIFGPNFSDTDSRIASTFLSQASRGEDLVMYSKGEQIRSYTFISDCVSGILSALLVGENGEAYNVSNTNNAISLHDFCSEIAKTSNVELNFKLPDMQEEKMATPIKHAVLSDEKLRKLGWQPRVSINEGVARTIEVLK